MTGYSVLALAARSNGDLYAGGGFSAAGGVAAGNIARWSGGAWSPLGSGVNSHVRALAFRPNGDLVGAGYFTTAGGAPADRIARWDGTVWSPMGDVPGGSVWVATLVVSPVGDLFAGSNDTGAVGGPAQLLRWSGTAWTSIGSLHGGHRSEALSLTALPNGDLFVGGKFATAGDVASVSIARYGCPPCYPDCNFDRALNLADFGCFQKKFFLADPYTDCNGDSLLNIADFGCFQTKFALGCP